MRAMFYVVCAVRARIYARYILNRQTAVFCSFATAVNCSFETAVNCSFKLQKTAVWRFSMYVLYRLCVQCARAEKKRARAFVRTQNVLNILRCAYSARAHLAARACAHRKIYKVKYKVFYGRARAHRGRGSPCAAKKKTIVFYQNKLSGDIKALFH